MKCMYGSKGEGIDGWLSYLAVSEVCATSEVLTT